MPPPVFIVGTMRSGSTLLRLILDSHENIAIGEETGFAAGLSAARTIPGWRYGAEWSTRIGWSQDERDERLREFYGGMFERHALDQGKKRWGDKTPFHSWHMQDMAEVFPDAVFVAIVRHPAAVVSSLKRKFHYAVPEAANYWNSTNTEVLRRGMELGPGRFAVVRYEDLVATPATVLRELVGWLGEPWSDVLLRHQEVQAAKGAPRLVDGSTSTRAPIDADRAQAWRQSMAPEEMSSVAERSSALARFFGYHPDDPAQLGRLVPADAEFQQLLTGPALVARQKTWVPPLQLSAPVRADTGMEMTPQEMARRVEQAESALARIRSRPIVRLSEKVRRSQKRLAVPRARDLVDLARRRSGQS